MITPQFAAGLIAFVGICLLAGWVTGFRNRSYVGLLGLAFVGLAGFLIAIGKVREAHEFGASNPGMAALAKLLLVLWVGALLLSVISAVRETTRRLQEIKEIHHAAAEGLLEIMRAGQQRETEPPSGEDEAPPADDTT